MKNNKQSGVTLLITVIMISICFIKISVTVKLYLLMKKELLNKYYSNKTYYLARSGFIIAKAHFNEIPYLEDTKNKLQIYNNISNAYQWPMDEKTILYLFKTSDQAIFSIGVINGLYKKIVQFKYEISNQTIHVIEESILQ